MFEKYLTLARDATTSGNRVAAENFYQHAEHYYRILNFNANPSGANGSGGARPRPNGGGGDGDASRDAEVMANGNSKDSGGLAVADDSKKQTEGSDETTAEAGNSDPEKTPSA